MSGLSDCGDRGVADLIVRHGLERADHPALVYPTRTGYRRLDYGTLRRRVAAIAAGLHQRGVRQGDKVVVLVPMSPALYLSLLAVASLGAVAVFVEPASTMREIARAIRVTRPRAFIGIPKAHVLRALDRQVAAVPLHVWVGTRLAGRAAAAVSLAEVERSGAGSAPPEVVITPDDPALLTFSSGSTGTPKAAIRSHAFLAAQHASIDRLVCRPEGEDDVHMSAFAIVLLSSLCAGQTAVIPPMGRGGVNDVRGRTLVELIRELGVNVISASPAFIEPLVRASLRRRRPLDDVRRVITGGAPVPVALCERADGPVFPEGAMLVVYGSTEAEPISTITATEVVRETADSTRAGNGLCVGRIEPELELMLVEPSAGPLAVGPGGRAELEVAPGQVGEVVVTGDHVNKRYFRNPDAERQTKIVDEHGTVWHRTGDAAYRDDRGRLWVVGRIADIVNANGRTYHPAAVEAAAQSVPDVARAALIQGRGGETVLVIEPRRRWPLRRGRLTDQLTAAGLEVDRVELARRLPVDPRHRAKLDYPAIRRQYA